MLHEGYIDKVYYRFWETDGAVANVFAIHGLGGHCIWFDNAGNVFNRNNINLFSFDLPGFGQSKYPKGVITSYKDWIDITFLTLENFLTGFKVSAPVFILGHSMGSLIAVLLSKRVKTNGWILSVPGFEGNRETWPLFSLVFPILLKAVFNPKENLMLPFGPELLTKNKETQYKVKKDLLRVTNVSAGVYKNVYFMTKAAKKAAKSLKEPVLMLIAGKDKVCSIQAMEDCFSELESQDKSKKIYTSSFHDLFIEDEIDQVATDIAVWVKERV